MQTLRAALNTMSRTSAVARLMPSSSKTALRLCSLHQIQSYSTLQKRVRPQCLTLSSDMVRLRRPPRRFNSTKPPTDPPKPNPTTKLGSLEPAPSLSQRLKKLSREYGYTAAGVYLALVVLDFPFCFLAVQYLGMERIGHWEHVVLGSLKNIVRILFPGAFQQTVDRQAQVQADKVEEDAKEEQAGEATIWTQLALAFVIHKSFIFARVPLTAALTPKVVKTLRGWGWSIGKRTPKTK